MTVREKSPEKIAIACGGCSASREVKPTKRENARLPTGWKRRPDPEGGPEAILCKDCWRKLYRLRAVSFPVAGVQEGQWKDFCAAVRQALFRSRSLAQWAVNQLAATDVSRTLDMQRLPVHPPLGREEGVYLYGLASLHYADWGEWSGAYTCAQGILRAMELKYNSRRLGIVWRADASVPTVRSCPYPVPAQNWSAEYVETVNEETGQKTQAPAVSIPLGGRRWLVRLRGGRQRARQLAAFRSIVSGAAEACELAIYRKRSQANRDRSGVSERGTGKKIRYDIMVKLVAWLPRETREGVKRDNGVLSVHSSKNAFLVAVHPDFERPWVVNRNDVRQRIFGHMARLQRMSEDMKAETRPYRNPPGPWRTLTPEERQQRRKAKRKRKRRLGYLDEIAHNFDNWHDSIVKEMASWLAGDRTVTTRGYADRIGVSKVILDFSETSYCPGYRWAALRDRIIANLADLSPPIAHECVGDLRCADCQERGGRDENNGDGDVPEPTTAG